MPSRLSAPSCRNEGGAPESRSREARGFSGELRPREEGSGASVPRLVQSGEATVHEPTSPADGRLPRRIRSRNPGTRSPTAKSWGLPPCSWARPEGDCIPAASLRPVLRRFSSLPRKTTTGLPGDSSFCCPPELPRPNGRRVWPCPRCENRRPGGHRGAAACATCTQGSRDRSTRQILACDTDRRDPSFFRESEPGPNASRPFVHHGAGTRPRFTKRTRGHKKMQGRRPPWKSPVILRAWGL